MPAEQSLVERIPVEERLRGPVFWLHVRSFDEHETSVVGVTNLGQKERFRAPTGPG